MLHSVWRSTGFERQSTAAPVSEARTLSAIPDITTTGIEASTGSSFFCLRNSQPSITGIIRSRKIRPGKAPLRSLASASAP
jgi:hypothetical protein